MAPVTITSETVVFQPTDRHRPPAARHSRQRRVVQGTAACRGCRSSSPNAWPRRRWRSRSPMSIATSSTGRETIDGVRATSSRSSRATANASLFAAARGLRWTASGWLACPRRRPDCAARSSRPSRPTSSRTTRDGVLAAGALGCAADVRRGGDRTPIHRVLVVERHEINPPDFVARRAGAYASDRRDAARHARGLSLPEAHARSDRGRSARLRPAAARAGAGGPRRPRPHARVRRHRRSEHLGAAAVCRSQLRRFQPVRHAARSSTRSSAAPTDSWRSRRRRSAARAGSSAGARSPSPRRTTIARSNTGASSTTRTSSSGRRRPRSGCCGRLTPRVSFRFGYEWDYTQLAAGDADRAEASSFPPNQVVHAVALGLDLQRGGLEGVRLVESGAADRLAAVGRARHRGLPVAEDATSSDTASASRAPRVLRPGVTTRVEAAVMGGGNLDRFSRYTFGTFDNRLRGYPSALIRYDRGAVLRTAVAWAAGQSGAARWVCRYRGGARSRVRPRPAQLHGLRCRRGSAGAVRHTAGGRVGLRLPRRQY